MDERSTGARPLRPVNDRAGYDPGFLGVDVPLPTRPVSPGTPQAAELVELPYTHFTVLLDSSRRLAAATAVGIDGASLMDLPREGIAWELDPRLPADAQTGEAVYAHNDLDRGHLVRRRDPTWGATAAEAEQANEDTFHYTNAAPQAAAFNQGETLWAGLEDYLLDNAATYDRRLVVLTGPVLASSDPTYRGTQIPLRFWKAVAFLDPAASSAAAPVLAATGYVLDQTAQLPDLSARYAAAAAGGEPPPLGPYRTYQVPLTDIAALTGLDLGPLPAVDRYRSPAAAAALPAPGAASAAWTQLTSFSDIAL
jgi:endonuclease G, mitochondrial